MTDIVHRLRMAYTEDDLDEAADDIERLRTEVDKCTVVRESLYEALATANKSVAERNAEIERLRSRLKMSIDYADGIPAGYGEDEIDRQQAEIERLRASERSAWNAAVQRDEEIERLRALLRETHLELLNLRYRVRETLGE